MSYSATLTYYTPISEREAKELADLIGVAPDEDGFESALGEWVEENASDFIDRAATSVQVDIS
jgi:hypothetical protein